ncbi:MAG: dihydrolipoyl dehydrogenase [Halobacteriovoraceae bacterium]|nr:dihydrolipoyl dehydrogenase [Halobacteriovoraceae bacterium]|tara:strand:- start:612 stop:2018 length:1407 start_codon:yes stop_codon:yes gene_type:complete
MREYDVVILGAGSAGMSARREVAKKTDNYRVFDAGKLGTTCARVGCMPSKVLIQAANDFYRKKAFAQEGIHGAESLSVNMPETLKHVRSLRDRFVRGVMGGMESWMETHLERKYATFIDAKTLDVEGEKVRFKKAIVATGSTPVVPPNFKEFSEFILTSDDLFEQEDLPKKMAVVGLGVIGIELGQALSRLGIEVVGINRRQCISAVTDEELNKYICDKMCEELNINFTGVKELSKRDDTLIIDTFDGHRYEVGKVFLSTGRSPNVEKCGLLNICNEVSTKRLPLYDKQTFQLKEHPHIFFAGDVNGDKPILHEASDEGKVCGYNAVRDEVTPFKSRVPLAITFSDPNIGYAGKTSAVLDEEGADYQIGRVSFEGQGRSIVKLKEIGLLKVYGDTKSGKLLGAEMFGPDIEHIAHLMAWAIGNGMTVNQALSMPFYHPVIEEGLRTALRDLREKVEEKAPEIEIYPLN